MHLAWPLAWLTLPAAVQCVLSVTMCSRREQHLDELLSLLQQLRDSWGADGSAETGKKNNATLLRFKFVGRSCWLDHHLWDTPKRSQLLYVQYVHVVLLPRRTVLIGRSKGSVHFRQHTRRIAKHQSRLQCLLYVLGTRHAPLLLPWVQIHTYVHVTPTEVGGGLPITSFLSHNDVYNLITCLDSSVCTTVPEFDNTM